MGYGAYKMKIHYFQRYHSKENVDTANAMLLLSRMYAISPMKFYSFLEKVLPENASVELVFNLQEKSKNSIPDAAISQASFKIVVETKLNNNFSLKQLEHHLESFMNEDYKVLLTLDPHSMNQKFDETLSRTINSFNVKNHGNIIHKHLTFEELLNSVNEVIDERDYEMQDVLDDYREYCYSSGLIPDDWKRMRVQLASTTLNKNVELNLYYDNAERGFSGHKYLGLYSQKAVRAIGEITTIATAIPNGKDLDVKIEFGELTEDMKSRIWIAIEDAKNYGYNLTTILHRYFFVDKFVDTFYEKQTPYPPRGSRIFNLCEVLDLPKLPQTGDIANLLRQKKW